MPQERIPYLPLAGVVDALRPFTADRPVFAAGVVVADGEVPVDCWAAVADVQRLPHLTIVEIASRNTASAPTDGSSDISTLAVVRAAYLDDKGEVHALASQFRGTLQSPPNDFAAYTELTGSATSLRGLRPEQNAAVFDRLCKTAHAIAAVLRNTEIPPALQ